MEPSSKLESFHRQFNAFYQDHYFDSVKIQGKTFTYQQQTYQVTAAYEDPNVPVILWFRIMTHESCYVFRINMLKPIAIQAEDWTDGTKMEVPKSGIPPFLENFISEAQSKAWLPFNYRKSIHPDICKDHFDKPYSRLIFPPGVHDATFFTPFLDEEGTACKSLKRIPVLLEMKNISQYGEEGIQTTYSGRTYTISTQFSYKTSTLELMVAKNGQTDTRYQFRAGETPTITMWVRAMTPGGSTSPTVIDPGNTRIFGTLENILSSIPDPKILLEPENLKSSSTFPWKWMALAVMMGFGLYYRESITSFFSELGTQQRILSKTLKEAGHAATHHLPLSFLKG